MRTIRRRLFGSAISTIAVIVLFLLVLLAIFGPIIWGDSADKQDVLNIRLGASWEHPFGTDDLGRDILARSLVATRHSLLLPVLASLIGVVIGVPLGILPAVLGDRTRRFVAAVISGAVALPALLLALFVNTIIGIGATGAVFGIGIATAPIIARLAQTLSAGVISKEYIAAARLLGASRTKLLFRHVLPNVGEPLILTATMSVGWSLLELAALSFLGVGIRPPDYDWGSLLNQGLRGIYVNAMSAIGPALFVVVSGIAFALLGESLAAATSRRARISRTVRKLMRVRPKGTSTSLGPDGPVLRVDGLTVRFPAGDKLLTAVDAVSFDLAKGERVGIVGESGSGKSQTAFGIAQLVDYPGQLSWRELRFDDVDLATVPTDERQHLLGLEMSLVSQDPMTALNPALRVGGQLAEVAQVHRKRSRKESRRLAVERLDHVRINDPAARAHQYPYEFSGGMRQRAVIAMGLMGEPKLIVADEPTTALDVTVQRQVLDLLVSLNEETDAALLMISHDIAVITTVCTRVLVMYAGRVVEDVPSATLLAGGSHPYTRALMAAVPTMKSDRSRPLATIEGRPPTLAEIPPGCPYAARCPLATERCVAEMPPLEQLSDGRRVACWFPQAGVADVVVSDELVTSL